LKSTTRQAPAPKHLSPEAKGRWKALVHEYDISDSGGLQILTAALEAFDACRTAEVQVQVDGATFTDRWGQPRPHPLLPVIRDSRAQFLAALKQLNLDVEPANHTIGRPGGK